MTGTTDGSSDIDLRTEPAAVIPAQRDAFTAYAECYALRLENVADGTL